MKVLLINPPQTRPPRWDGYTKRWVVYPRSSTMIDGTVILGRHKPYNLVNII